MFVQSPINPYLEDYLRDEFPTLLGNDRIVSALQEYGKFKAKEKVEEALQWNTKQQGPAVGVLHRGATLLWDTLINPESQVIFINWWLGAEFQFGKSRWDDLKTPAERDAQARHWQQVRDSGTAYDVGQSIYDTYFFTNSQGKRIWAAGAVILESLVRLGAMRAGLGVAEVNKQSTRFQVYVYGLPVVDNARLRLRRTVADIKKGVYGQAGLDALKLGEQN
jgi:hypothetical protein